MKPVKITTQLLRCSMGLGVVVGLLQPATVGARGVRSYRPNNRNYNNRNSNQNNNRNNQRAQQLANQQQGQTQQQQAAASAQWVATMLGELDGAVNLTPDQKKTITPLFQDEARQLTALSHKQNLAALDRAARLQQIQQGAEDKISKVLTPDQLQRIDEALGDKMLDNLSKQLTLTPDQKAKIRPFLLDEAKQTGALKRDTALTPEDRTAQQAAADDTAWEQIEPLLTPAQQKTLDQQRLDRMVENLTKQLTLTTDEVTKVKAALDATLPQMRATREDAKLTPAAKEQKLQGIRDTMWEKVGAALTLDQQKKLETLRYSTPKRAGARQNTSKP